MTKTAFWKQPTAALLAELGTTESGLTSRDAELRPLRYGSNDAADEAFDGFCRAFRRVGHLGRDKLNDKYSLITWVDDATFWLRDHQIYPSTLTVRDFVCAVLAHGDVDYVPLDRFPLDCSAFGLRRDSSGRPATDGWRAVLRTGRLREPVPLPRPTARRSPVQIAVGWGGR